MMKKIAVWFAFALAGLLLAVGVQAKTVRGEGRHMIHPLTHLMPFHAIEVRAEAQVDIWQKDTQSVSLSGKSNLVELADVRVENNTLVIDFKHPVKIKGNHALHVQIGVPHLGSITVRGNGRVRLQEAFETTNITLSAMDKAYVTADQLKADSVRMQATNQAEIDLDHLHVQKVEAGLFDKAEIELAGFAQEAQLVNNGSKEIDAADLRVNQAHVQVNATGDVEVFAAESLKAEALGKGEIVYHGHPVLMRSGNLKHIQPAFEN